MGQQRQNVEFRTGIEHPDLVNTRVGCLACEKALFGGLAHGGRSR